MVPLHSLEVPVSDNLTQLCYLSLPLESDPDRTGRPNQPVPIIQYVHGGPWARDSWGFHSVVQYYSNRGYGVMQCQFRSSTGFGRTFMNAGNGEWGRKMQQDLTDATNFLIQHKIGQKDKIAILGASYGGYATLVGLTMTPDLYACGVDIVGPSNLVTLMHSVPPYWKPEYNSLKRRIGADPDDKEGIRFLNAVSPLFLAHRIKRPLLIAQGANDPRVHQAESDQIVRELRKNRIPHTYMVFGNEGHGFVRPENVLAFHAQTEQFLAQCLGGRVEPMKGELKKATEVKIEQLT